MRWPLRPLSAPARRRWAMVTWGVGLAAVGGLAARDVAPDLVPGWGEPPSTGVSLVLGGASPERLDVDTGRREPLLPDSLGEARVRQVMAAAAGWVVVLEATGGWRTGQVVALDPVGEEPLLLGEADRVVPAPTGGFWLVVEPRRASSGSATLAAPSGTWRTSWLPVPDDRQVLGAVPDGLVTTLRVAGGRQLQVWEPRSGEPVTDLGRYGAYFGTLGSQVLASPGCTVIGCPVHVLDGEDGTRGELSLPPGASAFGTPAAAPSGDRVAVIGRDADGRLGLYLGLPDDLERVAEVDPPAGGSPVWAGDDHLVLAAPGRAVVWRPGEQPREVRLPPGARVVAARFDGP